MKIHRAYFFIYTFLYFLPFSVMSHSLAAEPDKSSHKITTDIQKTSNSKSKAMGASVNRSDSSVDNLSEIQRTVLQDNQVESFSAINFKPAAQSKEWLSMMYAIKGIFGAYYSTADADRFFLTKNGANNLQAELAASYQAIQQELSAQKSLNNESFSCRFPARSQFIREQFFGGVTLDYSQCDKLLHWRDRVSAESATLIFSSYYLGNPASTFGHTLLRLNNSGKNKSVRRELLSYGINYGANPWTENPILYTINGLIGLFDGTFAAIPYYYKVREYNDYESRDLWEYDLDLTEQEVEKMVDLLWEQGENFYNYYFLTENCGYYIAALIEAAAPRYEIMSGLRKWVIPSDTIVQIDKSGAIKNKKLRPSIFNQFLDRQSILDQVENKALDSLILQIKNKDQSWPIDFESLSEDSKAKVLDAALDYYDYNHSAELLEDKPTKNTIKDFMLNRRSQLPVALPLSKKDIELIAPEKAHGSMRYQLSNVYRQNKKNNDLEDQRALLGIRFALHDLEDPLYGEPEGAQIEVAHLKLSYLHSPMENKVRSLQLEELKFAEVSTYTDWTKWAPKGSLNVVLGSQRLNNSLCDNCYTGLLNVGYGISKVLKSFRFSFLLNTKYMYGDFSAQTHLNGWNYFSAGPRLIVQFDPSSEHQFRLEGTHESLSTAEEPIWNSEFVYRSNFSKDFSFELGAKTNEVNNEIHASIYYFTF